jgi:ABC-type multidrug transport system fused ATPase/permease subunit
MAGLVRLHPRPFAIAVFGATVYGFATVASSWVLGRVTDRVIVPRFEEGSVRLSTAAIVITGIVVVGVVKAAGIVTRRTAATIAVARIGATLRARVTRHFQQVPYEFHQRTPTGTLLSHAGADVDAASDALSPVPFSLGVTTILVTAVVWLLVTDLWLALVGLLLFPTIVVVNLGYQRIVEAPAEQVQAQLAEVSAVAHESFDGALIVKALHAEQVESDRFRRSAARLRDDKVRVATLRATFETLLDALPTLAIVALLPLGAWRVESGAVSVGTVVSFVSLFTLLTWPLRLIGYVLGEMPRAVVAHDRIVKVLAEPADARHTLEHGATARRAGAARLDVEGLSFAYTAGRPALDDVSFCVDPGRTVAVVGPTGAGKSTLLLLVSGLLRADGGTIRLDGRSIDDLPVDELRDEVAMAFQEAFVFGDTVAENILLADRDDLRDRELTRAAQLAGAERFVTRLAHGYDTVLGERGATLSGGQRQRVALARALVRRPRLLLLDDATSAVDPTTEARILAALRGNLQETTTLVVANRPSTIALADEVVFLDEGRVVDHGRHADLLDRQPGYEQLIRAYDLDRAARTS